jgi:hypothetical protein
MMSIPDLADIIAHAVKRGAKVVVAGDQEQLAADQACGGMRLLATRLGYVQLTDAVRFTAAWERDASLRLRSGDPTVLDVYAEHGRILSAPPEEALDLAARPVRDPPPVRAGRPADGLRPRPVPGAVAADP